MRNVRLSHALSSTQARNGMVCYNASHNNSESDQNKEISSNMAESTMAEQSKIETSEDHIDQNNESEIDVDTHVEQSIQQENYGESEQELNGSCSGPDLGINQSTSVIRIDEHQVRSLLHTPDANSTESSYMHGNIKLPNSYKYPLLKKYYEFGPWIGRNRKAICLGCHLQTSSSQPDRLLKHLNRCNALTEEDKVSVRELMNERTANKRKKPGQGPPRNKSLESDTAPDYCGDDNNSSTDDFSCQTPIILPAKNHKRLKTDRHSQIDEALTRFIMMCRIPLKSIHSKEFIDFCHALNPDYHIPSRETITNVLIPGLLNII